jgi:hypothetical protein
MPHSPEPQGKWLMRVLKYSADCDRALITAISALQEDGALGPSFAPIATRTAEAFRPTEPDKVIRAILFGRKTRLDLCQGAWILFHGQPYYW